ncbi:HupE/UreJ family protein [Roseibium salinum]|uniref:HupE/UreJ family protein n=1 Tax=Roseibium salinum TaxID=1604349 RepID=UPI00360957A3
MKRSALAIVLLFWCLTGATAHELRPAYLEMTEGPGETFKVLWKVPARGEFNLSLHVRLPGNCRNVSEPVSLPQDDSLLRHWQVQCPGGLAGGTISVDGLVSTYTDVLVRVERQDGTVQTSLLTPDAPAFQVTASPTTLETASTYLGLGVEHILLGIDHLLFVLALLLLIGNWRMLIATITAFTLAHSITLAFATLGLISIPQPPIEALIALSIVFVAAEVVRKQQGRSDLSSRYPWIIAFLFGLLHGFGFGGALRDIGLPQKDVPLALLTFNLGVEAGQLIFIALVLLSVLALKPLAWSTRPQVPAAYFIGSLSAFWFIERMTALTR